MEHLVGCTFLAEFMLPRSLEIQCVDKEHHHVWADTVNDFRDSSFRIIRAPPVDFPDS